MKLPFFNISGGLSYHSLAFRYQQKLWTSLKSGVDDLLKDWCPSNKRLLLIGPSGGYSLSGHWLGKFDRIDVLDPDPIAKMIFQRRFPRLPTHWHYNNYFTHKDSFRDDTFQLIEQSFPDHAVLFCNVLGQLPLLVHATAPDLVWPAQWQTHFATWAQKHSWASYHDLISTSVWPSPDKVSDLKEGLTAHDLAQTLYADNEGSVEITDHLTEDLFSFYQQKRRRWPWYLSPKSFHVIEGLCHNC